MLDPAEPIPAYLEIKEVDFTDSFSVAPRALYNHRIADAWVSIDNKLQGVYEIPFNVPILEEGKHIITISSGIFENGFATLRGIYPLYTTFTDTITLEPGKKITLQPNYKYKSSINATFIENFESIGSSFDSTSKSDTRLITVQGTFDQPALDGNGFGMIYLKNEIDTFEFESIESFSYKPGNPVFLELNFKCDVDLGIGLGIVTDGKTTIFEPKLFLFPTQQWKKSYILLKDDLDQIYRTLGINSNIKYKIILKGLKRSEVSEAKIMVDNIRLIYQ